MKEWKGDHGTGKLAVWQRESVSLRHVTSANNLQLEYKIPANNRVLRLPAIVLLYPKKARVSWSKRRVQ